MNFIEKLKYKKTEEYQDYENAKNANNIDIVRFNDYYVDTKLKLDEETKKLIKLNELLKQRNTDVEYLNKIKEEIIIVTNEVNRLRNDKQKWNYEYEKSLLISDFIRPNTKEEIESRNQIANTFADSLKEIVGSESNLRFHGTPIYFAKEIIKSNSITSSADRYDGYIASSDMSGSISASTINSLSRTIDYFTDFASYTRCLPCGVLFVLNEKDGDCELRDRSEMQNVDFKKNPEQLVAIVCTDEVKNMVINWCNEYNMDSNKVFSYNEFLEYAKNNDLEKSKTL